MDDTAKLQLILKKINILRGNFENRKNYKFQLLVPLFRLANAYMTQIKDSFLYETIKTCQEAIDIIGDHCIFVLVKFNIAIFREFLHIEIAVIVFFVRSLFNF